MIRAVIIGVLLGLFVYEKNTSSKYKKMYEHELKVNQEYNGYSMELKQQIQQYDMKLNYCFSMNHRHQQEQLSCYRELQDLKNWIKEIEKECKQITKKCKKGL